MLIKALCDYYDMLSAAGYGGYRVVKALEQYKKEK